MSLFREEVTEFRKTRLHGEVILTQPLSTRFMTATLFVIIAITMTWISLGSYARIETVQGILVTSAPSAKVIAVSQGTVIELNAQEGKVVKQGDRLAVINLDRSVASGLSVAGRSLEALDSRRQLTKQQLGLTRLKTASERVRLQTVASNAEQQAISLRAQIELQEQVVLSNQQLFDQISKVVERGFVTQVDYERRRQTLLGSQLQLAALQQQLSSRLSDGDQARSQISGLAADAAQSAVDIASSLQGLSQQQAQLEGEQGYVITAPISGRVTALQAAIGRTANPGLPLMLIVPDSSELTAELYAPTRAIGFVKQGQETRILFDAFPYQRFGSFGGRVESVSRTIIDPREAEVPIKLEEAVYRITVKLDQQDVVAYGDKISLQPGMTLQANVVLERQSFLTWLLRPLNAVLKRSA